QIMDLLTSLQQQFHMAVIMITHDLGLAATYTAGGMVMYAGRVVEQAATRALFAMQAGRTDAAPDPVLFSNVRMPYTRALLDAMPHLDRSPHELLPLVPGRAPTLAS